MTDRYSTSHLPEDQYEPGSNGTVLRNLLGISSLAEMKHVEEVRFERLMEDAAGHFSEDHTFTVSDIIWLSKVSFLGQEPTVMSTSARAVSCSLLLPTYLN